MPKIKQLDPHVADLIAAGEVVERPASVVKELMENAIDAGATAITVEIQRGGMSYIRVTDNGCGIAPADAEIAFLRHATSKIRQETDLESIGTLGFRGEALAAIAAVSHIELLTHRAEDEFGTALLMDAGVLRSREDAGGPVGTTMIVRDLFFNTPARLKFMKRDASEGAAVFAVVQHAALSHPEVAVTFLREGKKELQTPGDGQQKSVLYAVLGRDVALGYLPVTGSGEDLRIEGYVSMPACCRGTRGYQHFFVNGRYVKSRTMMAALEEAYKNQKMVGKFPGCVLYITTRLNAVDVNVHPTKTEIKFTSEKKLFDCVYYNVKAALEHQAPRLQMDLDHSNAAAALPKQEPSAPAATPPVPSRAALPVRSAHSEDAYVTIPSETATASQAPAPRFPGKQNFFQTMTTAEYRAQAARQQASASIPVSPTATEEQDVKPLVLHDATKPTWSTEPSVQSRAMAQLEQDTTPVLSPTTNAEVASSTPTEQVQTTAPVAPSPLTEAPPAAPDAPVAVPQELEPAPDPQIPNTTTTADWRIAGELFNTYIMVEQGDKVVLIDKHAAHERMNFDRLKSQGYRPMAQQLLTPLVFTPTAEEGTVLLQNVDLLADFAFEYEDFGDGTLLIRQIPCDIDPDEAASTLSELAGKLLTTGSLNPDSARDDLLHTIACKAAIKGGQRNGPKELQVVAEAVMADRVRYCPHGRPVAIELTRKQLEKQFKRIT